MGRAMTTTIPSILRTRYALLPTAYRKKAPLLLGVLLLEAVLDVLALASAVPLIYHLSASTSAGRPALPALRALHDAFGQPSESNFALVLVLCVLAAFVV